MTTPSIKELLAEPLATLHVLYPSSRHKKYVGIAHLTPRQCIEENNAFANGTLDHVKKIFDVKGNMRKFRWVEKI